MTDSTPQTPGTAPERTPEEQDALDAAEYRASADARRLEENVRIAIDRSVATARHAPTASRGTGPYADGNMGAEEHDPALDNPAGAWAAIVLSAYERKPFTVAGVRYAPVPDGEVHHLSPNEHAALHRSSDEHGQTERARVRAVLLDFLGQNLGGPDVDDLTDDVMAALAEGD